MKPLVFLVYLRVGLGREGDQGGGSGAVHACKRRVVVVCVFVLVCTCVRVRPRVRSCILACVRARACARIPTDCACKLTGVQTHDVNSAAKSRRATGAFKTKAGPVRRRRVYSRPGCRPCRFISLPCARPCAHARGRISTASSSSSFRNADASISRSRSEACLRRTECRGGGGRKGKAQKRGAGRAVRRRR